MKKLLKLLIMISIIASASPALALFTNGGFETGDFTGWTITYGSVTSDTYHPDWGYTPYGTVTPTIVTTATFPDGYQTLNVDPYNGTKMAKINDAVGYYHATKISQTATIAADDIGDTMYVNWGAVLENPSHPTNAQPVFSIQVSKNGAAMNTFFADATNAAATWTPAGTGWGGDTLYYKAGQYTYDLSGFAVGDSITIDMWVTDCGWGGHGGYAFLDGIGTEYVPPPPGTVPIPPTAYLLAAGLLGTVGLRRKAKK